LTAPTLYGSLALGKPHERELPPIVVDEEDPERTHTAWLYVQAPWWRKLLLRRQRVRRYFVFSGTTVSCFSVNKEGKRASFTHTVTSCSYDPGRDPASLELECGPHRKLRLGSKSDAGAAVVAATAKHVRRALDTSNLSQT
jgi:hypothetical protein